MKVDDIQGTKPKPYPSRSTNYSSLDYTDVTNTKFVSKRSTNPLNPSYFHKTEDGQVEEIGQIDGSQPKDPAFRNRGPKCLSLDIHDIDGTKVGTKGLKAFKTDSRRDYREINKVDDIQGAKVGSLLKGPKTNRVVNPLNPQYPLPGAKELEGRSNPYGENVQAAANKPSTAPVNARRKNFSNQKVPNLDKEKFKRDIGNFHSTNPGFMQEVDFKEIQKG